MPETVRPLGSAIYIYIYIYQQAASWSQKTKSSALSYISVSLWCITILKLSGVSPKTSKWCNHFPFKFHFYVCVFIKWNTIFLSAEIYFLKVCDTYVPLTSIKLHVSSTFITSTAYLNEKKQNFATKCNNTFCMFLTTNSHCFPKMN